jgi:hypothetical protein
MAIIRKTPFVLCLAAFLGAATTGSFASASSDMLNQYKSLCAQNVQCSSQETERGYLFRLQMQNRIEKMLCQSDGACEALLPRSVRYPVEDAQRWFTVK